MAFFLTIFGNGKDINTLQMCCRGIAVFIIALVLIRISGRRSFGLRTPLDNIIAVLLGSILSRTVVGASPFVPVIVACLVIVCLHRIVCWFMYKGKGITHIIQGKEILLYDKGKFHHQQMKKALVNEDDVMQGVRKSAMTDDLGRIERVYMERNGEISAILKNQQ
jgi:uncharacterized membrane protein YcaP (DUF421 family)